MNQQQFYVDRGRLKYAGRYVSDGKVVKVSSDYGSAEAPVQDSAEETAKALLVQVLNSFYAAPR